MIEKKITFQRTDLYCEIWKISLSKVAAKYHVPFSKLKEACQKANIPLPTNKYWGDLSVGKAVSPSPLPESSIEEVTVVFKVQKREQLPPTDDPPFKKDVPGTPVHQASPSSKYHDKKTVTSVKQTPNSSFTQKLPLPNEELSFLLEEERANVLTTACNLHVRNDGHKLHPVLLKHKSAFSNWKKQYPRDEFAPRNRDPYRKPPEGEPPLWDAVSEDTLPRVYLILDVLFRAIESLGGTVNPNLSLQIRGENVIYHITEGRTKTAHTLTKTEQKQWDKYEKDKTLHLYAYEPKFRKYDYIPTGKLTFAARRDSYLRDTDNIVLEGRLGEILLALYIESEKVRIEREKREAAQRKADEEKRQKELLLQRWDEEIDKLHALENEAADYERACKIRTYVAAVKAKTELTEDENTWILWASAKADWLDPTIAANDSVFGPRNHSQSEDTKAPKRSGHIRRYWW